MKRILTLALAACLPLSGVALTTDASAVPAKAPAKTAPAKRTHKPQKPKKQQAHKQKKNSRHSFKPQRRGKGHGFTA